MSQSVKLAKEGTTTIQFDVVIEGAVQPENIKANFVLNDGKMNISVPCSLVENSNWKVEVPSFDFLNKDNLNYKIEVIADHYYFVPVEGSVIFEVPEVKTQNITESFSDEPPITEPQTEKTPNNKLLKPEFNKGDDSTKRGFTPDKISTYEDEEKVKQTPPKKTKRKTKKDISSLIKEIKEITTETQIDPIVVESLTIPDLKEISFNKLKTKTHSKETQLTKTVKRILDSI